MQKDTYSMTISPLYNSGKASDTEPFHRCSNVSTVGTTA
jgi:hypothetical protein